MTVKFTNWALIDEILRSDSLMAPYCLASLILNRLRNGVLDDDGAGSSIEFHHEEKKVICEPEGMLSVRRTEREHQDDICNSLQFLRNF